MDTQAGPAVMVSLISNNLLILGLQNAVQHQRSFLGLPRALLELVWF